MLKEQKNIAQENCQRLMNVLLRLSSLKAQMIHVTDFMWKI